ncbi:uncharacterized protein PRCAT00001251001 [Priceomyces carsonii]|uniref:uncharacterized protein n=1 Tax=Priceomyces carsonii TaxID=28549 RepID=UPI002ED9743A|nr:unnamed protein product [Priceomyces carsonii]
MNKIVKIIRTCEQTDLYVVPYISTLSSQKNIFVRDSLVARITVCRMVDRGSIPRLGAYNCANGLVVKSNVAIVGPPVRFRVCAKFLTYFCTEYQYQLNT